MSVDRLSQVTRPGPADPEPAPFTRALVVVAHADDCDFSCSGTAAKWAADGASVTVTVMTDGSKGSHDLTIAAEDVVRTREAEQREAAEILGFAEPVFLRFVDGELKPSREAVEAVVATIRGQRPDVVLTHDPWRRYMLHPDHRAVGEIVCDAVYLAGEPRFRADLGARWKPRELWLFSAEEPNHVEDVSDWFGLKQRAMLVYRSQYNTAFKFVAGDADGQAAFEDWFAGRFREIGRRAGFRYGEEFRRIPL